MPENKSCKTDPPGSENQKICKVDLSKFRKKSYRSLRILTFFDGVHVLAFLGPLEPDFDFRYLMQSCSTPREDSKKVSFVQKR